MISLVATCLSQLPTTDFSSELHWLPVQYKVLATVSVLITAVLRSRCGPYIFVLFLSSSFFSFFPRLISAVADWMSTILPYMVWL